MKFKDQLKSLSDFLPTKITKKDFKAVFNIATIFFFFPLLPYLVGKSWPWYFALPLAFACFCLAAIISEYLPS